MLDNSSTRLHISANVNLKSTKISIMRYGRERCDVDDANQRNYDN